MTAAEFNAALDALGWSRRHLVKLLDCDPTLAQRWATGRAEVPDMISWWLLALVADHKHRGVPIGWRTRPVREAAE